jgi:hypothetical protein
MEQVVKMVLLAHQAKAVPQELQVLMVLQAKTAHQVQVVNQELQVQQVQTEHQEIMV